MLYLYLLCVGLVEVSVRNLYLPDKHWLNVMTTNKHWRLLPKRGSLYTQTN